MRVTPADDAPRQLDSLDKVLRDRYRLRFSVVKTYASYSLVVLVSVLALAMSRRRWPRLLGPLGLGVALAPLALLLSPVAGLQRAWLHLLAAVAIGALLVRLAAKTGRPAPGLALVMLSGAGLMALDAMMGSGMMRKSALGFGVMLGSRFYGIGNEYAGVLMGMTTVGLGGLLQVAPRAGKAAAACGVALVWVMGAPWWGANWGGSFAAACGLVTLWVVLSRPTRPAVVIGAAAALAAAASMPAALDLVMPSAERSHIGMCVTPLLCGDAVPLTDSLLRKLAMQWWILGQAPWMVFGVPLTAAAWWALLRAGGAARRALEGQRPLAAGLAGALIAGIVATVVNDTGLIAGSGAFAAATGTVVFLAGRCAEIRS